MSGTPLKIDKFIPVKSKLQILKILTLMSQGKAPTLDLRSSRGCRALFHAEGMDGEHLFGRIETIEGRLILGEKWVARTQIASGEYFFETRWKRLGTKDLLSKPEIIFALSKRSVRRLKIPQSTHRSVNIFEHRSQTRFLPGQCLDISPGGAQVAILGKSDLAPDDQLRLAFHLKNKWNFEVKADCRYVRLIPPHLTVIGVEFQSLSRTAKSLIETVILDLAHEAILGSHKKPSG